MAATDLLEQPSTQVELDEKERHYAEAGKSLRELSHALKNLLQMVCGAAEVIDYGLQTKQMDKVEKSWWIFSQNIKRLKKSLLDILDFTKKQPLEKCSCNLNEEIKRVLNSLKSVGQAKKFKLQAQLDASLPEVEVDPERIGLMTLNMLLHAIDQVEEGTGIVQIQTRYNQNKNEFEISVTDNAPAYSQELQHQLFTPHETHQQRFSTGIGIVLARQIATQHGGDITLRCEHSGNTMTAIISIISHRSLTCFV